VKRANIQLSEAEARMLLDALKGREAHMQHICDNSDDEDEIADVGNDLVELRLFIGELSQALVKSFGEAILQLRNDPL
jgi:hypothetical protein